MIRKLEAHGVRGELLNWISSWTQGRTQRVVLNGIHSSWADVLSSVVQGSVLGPVLFVIFINDIDLAIPDPITRIYKYADDSKLGRPVRSPEDAAALQSAIHSVAKWAERWGMEIHPTKTLVMHFGHNNEKYEYELNGVRISPVASARDLGVIVTDSGKPSEHATTIAKKANSILSQLNRTMISRSRDVILNLFKIFVRPTLESAGVAWCPWEKKDIEIIEKIQRRTTRMIPGLGGLSYEERLKACNLTTLERRRERGDAIEMFKILNGYSCNDLVRSFCFASQRHDVSTRSAANKSLVPEKCHLDVRKNFFTNRAVQVWNALPLDVREAESVNNFKNRYDDWKLCEAVNDN